MRRPATGPKPNRQLPLNSGMPVIHVVVLLLLVQPDERQAPPEERSCDGYAGAMQEAVS